SFAMTEPDVASSDATNIRTRIERDGDQFIVNGRKWFISGAMSGRCKIAIVMGVTDPDAEPHRRQSMVLIPMDTPGVSIRRGLAERALDLMCRRALDRSAFGKRLAEHEVIADWIARSRVEIEQARLLVLKTAWLMDTVGKEGARIEVSAIKVAAPEVATKVIDRAIQVHGAAGLSEDFLLAELYAAARALRILDGPDEVHAMVIARRELKRYLP